MPINNNRPGGYQGFTTPTGQEVLTNKDIDGGTASNTSRITLPKASKTALDALSRKQGTIVFASDLNKAYVDDGSTLRAVGSGSGQGELNCITNPSADTDTTGWTGGFGHTVSRITSGSPLDPIITTAFRINATAADIANYQSGAYTTFTLPTGLESKKLKIEFYAVVPATNTWQVAVYDGSTRLPLSTDVSSATTLPAGFTGKFTAYFDTTANNTYNLSFTKTAYVGSSNLDVTSIIVGPGIQAQSAAVSSLGNIACSTSGFGTISNSSFKGWRIGNLLKVQASFESGTVTASAAAVVLPTGLTVDTSLLSANQDSLVGLYARSQSGAGQAFFNGNSGAMFYDVSAADTTKINISPNLNGSQDGAFTAFGASSIFGNGDEVILEFEVPIAEWAGSGTVNVAQNDKQYLSNSNTSTSGNDTSAFQYGPSGASVVAVSSAGNWVKKRVQLQQGSWTATGGTPIVKVSPDGLLWLNALDVFPPLDLAGAYYGIDIQVAGSNTVDVAFGGDGANQSTAWSSFTAYKWRVDVAQSNEAVGFGLATNQTSGLISGRNNAGATMNVASVQSADADKTLTDLDNHYQVFTGLTASRAVTLPTSGVVLGDIWKIENTTSFDLVIKSSNGTALTVGNSANMDATISTGYVLLRALVSTPTLPSEWRIVEVYEKSAFGANFNQGAGSGGSGTSKTITAFRHNNVVTLGSAYLAITTGGSAASSYGTASGEIPTRFRPVNDPMFFTNKYVGGAGQTDSGPTSITISSSGAITIYRVFQRNSNWPASTGDTGADYLEATYKNN